MEAKEESSGSASVGTAEKVPEGREDRRALFRPIFLAAVLLGATTYVAFTQPPQPNALDPAAFPSLEWWTYPIERDAFARLPVITGYIRDVYVDRDGQKIWAVGNGGLIVHSGDGGTTWARQVMPTTPAVDPKQAPPDPKQVPPSVPAPPEDILGVQFADDRKTGWAVGVGGTILSTRDGGET